MRTPRVLLTAAAALAVALPALLAAPSSADPGGGADRGAPGTWTRISSGSVGNVVEPGLYRTSNGILHVFYRRERGAVDDIAFTNIGANGRTGATGSVVAGWSALSTDPKPITTGSGMRVMFAGIRTGDPLDPYHTGQMFASSAVAAGTSWFLEGAFTDSAYAIDSYGTGATTLANHQPVVSFPLNATMTWNDGVDHTFTFSQALYGSTLVRSGSQVWISFAALGNTAGTTGLFVKRLLPTVGPTTKVPQSSQGTSTLSPLQSTAFVARPGGGLHLAYCIGYPTCSKVGLWRVGTAQARAVPGSAGARDISLSAAPHGRMWVAWTTYDRVKVVPTSATGLTFGGVRTLRQPNAAGLYGVNVAGTDRSADVVVNNGSALFHQQVRLP
ncbi:hypothetical protein [Nocardioides sp.]|uniref:hypothetical protein n=1 Tax=Nocardioides sp. TaxID=35761 RepID=UPI0037843F37